MHELSQQMEEQKARKAAEEQAQVKCKKTIKGSGLGRSGRYLDGGSTKRFQGRDWWEGRGQSVAEYSGPHPSQVIPFHSAENVRKMLRNEHSAIYSGFI